jgi:hypothetical protein
MLFVVVVVQTTYTQKSKMGYIGISKGQDE